MKKVLRSASALAAIVIAAPVAAHATDGWYGRADVGYSFAGGVKYKSTPGPTSLNGKGKHEQNWTEHVGVGYAFSNGFRLEGELGHRFNRTKAFSSATGSLIEPPSDTHVYSAMLNGYYDFNKGGNIEPYIGAGVGAGRVKLNAASLGFVDAVNKIDTKLAWQGMAGVAFRLSPQLDLDVGARYFAVPGLKAIGSTNPNLRLSVAKDFKADYDQAAATIGLRWQFAPPAPPPAPPPPPVVAPPVVQVCPAQDFKVYFEWDRSNLNAAANDTISSAAARAKACNVSTVRVVGYTDTSGSAKYNLGLSNRRAAVVRDALVSSGIPAALVSTEGLGETNLDKATRDGVREPLNRRTAVTISFQ